MIPLFFLYSSILMDRLVGPLVVELLVVTGFSAMLVGMEWPVPLISISISKS